MSTHKESVNFFASNMAFIIFFLFFALLAFIVTAPIAAPLVWAMLLSFISRPVYKFVYSRLLHGRFPSTAAAITLAVFLIICVVPILFAISALKDEAAGMAISFYNMLGNIQHYAAGEKTVNLSWLPAWAAEYVSAFLKNTDAVKSVLQPIAQWSAKFMSSFSTHLLEQASSFVLNVVITAMVSFFFIRDGMRIVDYVKSILPLSRGECDDFVNHTANVLHSIVYGVILTVAVQAILGGLGWWFVGLSSPALFALFMFFFGMFPAGTAVVWLPGSIYLALTGDMKNAIFLFIWGAAIVSSIDNFLRPFLISAGGGGCEIPTMLITMGLFGGVMSMGFLGIFLGPLFLVLFVSVCNLYRKRWIASLGE